MKTLIKDPTLYHLIFLFRWHALEKREEFELHKGAIKNFFLEAWKKVDPKEPFPETEVNNFLKETENILFAHEKVENLFKDIRILNSGIKRGNLPNLKLELEIRAYDDAVRIQINYFLEGEYPIDFLSVLKKELLDTNRLKKEPNIFHTYIGETYYPAVQIEKCEEQRAKEFALEIMKYLGYPEEEFSILKFSWGYLAINQNQKESPVILYWDNGENIWTIAKIVHKIFPFLFLNRYKFFYILKSYFNLRDKLNEQERKINDLCVLALKGVELKKSEKDIQILKKMEASTVELSEALTTYVQNLAILKGYIKEIEVLLEGMGKLLGETSLQETNFSLTDFWTKDVKFTKEQLNTNLNFYWLTKETSDSTLDFLYKIAEIRDSQWDRFTNFLVGILSAWTILDAFESNLSWLIRLILLFILAPAFYFLLPKLRIWLKM